jgi:hypothetical protein
MIVSNTSLHGSSSSRRNSSWARDAGNRGGWRFADPVVELASLVLERYNFAIERLATGRLADGVDFL